MAFLQIPGNIHQSSKIFVQDPNNKINSFVGTSRDLAGAKPQVFTYKNDKDITGKHGKLNFYPSSLEDVMINDDIAFKLLYGKDKPAKGGSITVQDILDTIPGIQIREFLPDTRLDQCINLFADMFSAMTSLFSEDDSESKSGGGQADQETKQEKNAKLYQKISAATMFTMNYMLASYPNGLPSFLNDMGDSFAGETFDIFSNMKSEYRMKILQFPFAFYYNLQSCVTNNIYYVPAVPDSKMILQSGDGMAGWTSGGDILSEGGMRMSGLLGKIPVVGGMLNMVLGNIGINYMPWWNADAGTKVKEPEITVKFDLFNDTADAAMANFLFVNTIVPSNKFIQYGMFQHSSSIYDVKIEGINRLFACAGDFKVSYEGVLRDPPDSWLKRLADSHHSPAVAPGVLYSTLKENKLIKLPDIYRVEMRFQSLLNASFNNYVFNYACNQNVIHKVDKGVYKASGLAKALPNGISKYLKRVTKVWKAGKEDAGK